MIFNNEIENGTVSPSLPNYSTKYSISTSDVYDTVPGSSTYENFDEGARILRIYPSDPEAEIIIEKDWTNRKSLSNQNQIILKKGNLSKIFKFIKIYPYSIDSLPATRIVFASTVTSQDLIDFIGATGIPGASGLAYLSLYPQNDLVTNDLSSSFTLQKNVQNYQREEFSAVFTWTNNNNVKKNDLRWRATPVINRVTNVSYQVENVGEYEELPSAFVSGWGEGETIALVGSIVRIEVVDGGEFQGTPQIVATYSGGSGASFSVGMTGSAIDNVSVIQGGIGYNASPILSYTGATVVSAPSLVTYVGITAVNVLTTGYDYVEAPRVQLSGGVGTGGTVTTSVQVYNEGRVDYVAIIDGGIGYTSGQEIIFTGGSGSNARATIVAENGEIVSVKMLDYGYGYTSEPTVSVTGGGTGANLQAVVSLYSDWNYVTIDPGSPTHTIYNMKKYLEYEWQIYSATELKQNFVSYSSSLKFKFF